MHFMAKLDKLFRFEDYFLFQTVGGSPYDCYNGVGCPQHQKHHFCCNKRCEKSQKSKEQSEIFTGFFSGSQYCSSMMQQGLLVANIQFLLKQSCK